MKYLYTLIAVLFLFGGTSRSQDITFRHNPYSGMNENQLELALEQARKMERSGKIWTAVGAGMFVGGAVMTFDGFLDITADDPFNFRKLGTGMGIMCLGAFPLGYGLVAWFVGHERANMIEIELLAFNTGTLNLTSTENGFGLVLAF